MTDRSGRRLAAPAACAAYRERGVDAIAGTIGSLVPRIRTAGPLAFNQFMAAALYDPEEGYYARRSDQVGRSGDFFTSVSAGPLFGQLLAASILSWWEESGRPEPFRVIEIGAHDGSLALDILGALRDGPAFPALEYVILEPLEPLAAVQKERLAAWGEKVSIFPDPAVLEPGPAFLVANEVLDALPFHIVESDGSGWREIGVGLDEDGGFIWADLGPAGPLAANLPVRPAGYRTEVRPDFADFLAPLARIVRGRMLWIDYGFERGDYYDSARTEGTLRTFRGHQAGDDPLQDPGESDITAHVEFTALQEAVEALGGRVARFENQARYLTRAATPWLESLEGRTDPATHKLLRNFQTLTHPAHLGRSFHVMETEWA